MASARSQNQFHRKQLYLAITSYYLLQFIVILPQVYTLVDLASALTLLSPSTGSSKDTEGDEELISIQRHTMHKCVFKRLC